jgi:hypothetical protein
MDALPRVVLICASRSSPKWFERETLLGRSLQNFPEQLRPEAHLLLNNHGDSLTGLSEFYNSALDAIEGDAFVVFVHDDVYIHDWNSASLSLRPCVSGTWLVWSAERGFPMGSRHGRTSSMAMARDRSILT